jgi:hypothetical protein
MSAMAPIDVADKRFIMWATFTELNKTFQRIDRITWVSRTKSTAMDKHSVFASVKEAAN